MPFVTAARFIVSSTIQLKLFLLDLDPGDITTIEEEGSVEEARDAWSEMRVDVQNE